MVSVATKETTGGSAGGKESEGPFLGHFKANAAAVGSSDDLFFEALPPRVFTMVVSLNR